MHKRTKQQLTREIFETGEADADTDEQIDKPKIASQEVMSHRKIAHPRSRFSAGGAKAKATAATVTAGVSSTVSLKDKATQLKSLNANFLQSVNDAITLNPVADLLPILSKYEEYYGKVDAGKIIVKNVDVPKVDVKPSTEAPVFGFKPESVKVPEKRPEVEDAEEKKEEPKKKVQETTSEGPKFTIDSLPKSSDYGFKFGYVPPASKDDDDDDVKIEGPSFKLTAQLKKPDPNAAFKLPEKSTGAPAFSFSAPKKEAVKEETKPAPAKPAPAKSAPVESAPAPVKPAPAFSFGEKKDAKPAFSFTASKDEKSDDAKSTPAFSFGATKTEEKKDDKATPAKATPAFSFTASDAKDAPAFSFGKTDSKPASAFSFGSTTSTAAPAFNFGSKSTDTNPFSSSKPPSMNFTFSAPKTPAASEAKDESKEKQQNFTVTKLTDKVETKTGEEDESTLFTKRTKVSKLNSETRGYDTVGVGELKVLSNEKTGKSRILVRSDGSGNVLLNTNLLKDAKYDLVGTKKNMLRIPAVSSEGKMETYVALVKTGDDGKSLLEKVDQCQSKL